MSKLRNFSQINTSDVESQLIQQNIQQAVSGAIKTPILDGRLIRDIGIASGNTKIEHKLARVPIGYIIVDITNNVTIYRVSKDANYITLASSGATTASIWIF